MILYFYNLCSRKNVTATLQRVCTEQNPADEPSRFDLEILIPSKRVEQQIQKQLFSEVITPVSLSEIVEFWSKKFRLDLPDFTV